MGSESKSIMDRREKLTYKNKPNRIVKQSESQKEHKVKLKTEKQKSVENDNEALPLTVENLTRYQISKSAKQCSSSSQNCSCCTTRYFKHNKGKEATRTSAFKLKGTH